MDNNVRHLGPGLWLKYVIRWYACIEEGNTSGPPTTYPSTPTTVIGVNLTSPGSGMLFMELSNVPG